MKILITGGCGFVGVNLVKILAANGHALRILDNFSTGKREFLSELSLSHEPEVLAGDVRDKAAVETAVQGMEAVVHLAAHTSVIESLERPAEAWEINVSGLMNVLEACRVGGCDRFVFASSNAAVGEQVPPISETMIPRPLSPYGASKLAGEALCSGYYHSYGMKTVALRFANVYGPHSTHKTSVVAKFLRLAREGKPFVIYGDGEQTRDFVHIADICEAIRLALSYDTGGEVFQIASGRETTINVLVKLLNEVVGTQLEAVYEPERKGEIRRNYSDIGKARRMLGFEPKVELRQGLRTLAEVG